MLSGSDDEKSGSSEESFWNELIDESIAEEIQRSELYSDNRS